MRAGPVHACGSQGLDDRGFVFYTNYESRKSQELQAHPFAALTFWWGDLEVRHWRQKLGGDGMLRPGWSVWCGTEVGEDRGGGGEGGRGGELGLLRQPSARKSGTWLPLYALCL